MNMNEVHLFLILNLAKCRVWDSFFLTSDIAGTLLIQCISKWHWIKRRGALEPVSRHLMECFPENYGDCVGFNLLFSEVIKTS